MKLGKPPVVEVSVEFRFESSPAEPWTFKRADKFMSQFQDGYPELEAAALDQLVEVQKLSRNKRLSFTPQRVPVAVRAFPADRSRYLVTSQDAARCIFLRTEAADYPGFAALKAESMRLLEAYVRDFRPAKMIGVVLRYVDFFHIPTADGRADLKEYLTVCTEPAEAAFGPTVRLRQSFTTRPPDVDGLLSCELHNVQGKRGAEAGIPFRMEWALHAYNDLTWQAGPLAARLQQAHDQLLRCFRQSFTPKGWTLFDPEPEDGEP